MHIFTILLSILITAYYAFFEFTTPTSTGTFSVFSSIISSLISISLIVYMTTIIKKFKTL